MRFCGIFSAISALSKTENSDDLEIRVSDRSRSLKVVSYRIFVCHIATSEFLTCHFLLRLTVPEALSCTVYEI